MYKPRVHYTPEEQLHCILSDLRNDIEHAERQAAEGPYFVATLGREAITPRSLLAYAESCRKKIAQIEAREGRVIDTVNAFIAGKV